MCVSMLTVCGCCATVCSWKFFRVAWRVVSSSNGCCGTAPPTGSSKTAHHALASLHCFHISSFLLKRGSLWVSFLPQESKSECSGPFPAWAINTFSGNCRCCPEDVKDGGVVSEIHPLPSAVKWRERTSMRKRIWDKGTAWRFPCTREYRFPEYRARGLRWWIATSGAVINLRNAEFANQCIWGSCQWN